MKLKPETSSRTLRCLGTRMLAGAALLSGLMTSCSDGYDLAEKTPDWLGSSIYDYLQSEGRFTQTVRLIDDLRYNEVLAKTGSKTLFVADDEAFQRFYQNNTWGVSKYEDLTDAQKKLLLYGSMINNACQVAYLSSSEGPTEGDCMRRLTASSEYDSIPVMSPDQMPQTPYWQYYRDNSKSIACANDFTAPPMVHFIEQFLQNKLITNADCDFLNNYADQRTPGDAHVNGVKMINQNVKCSNGFVHEMAEVTLPQPNMAQYVTQTAELSQFAKLMNRFCAPYYVGKTATDEYNRLNPNAPVDSLFQKRYFSIRSNGGELENTPAGGAVNGQLKFDPGWNQFYSETTASTATNVAVQENMGVMLVPTNEALDHYWNEGAGKPLKERYGSWDNVPDNVVSKMINVNMLNSFVMSVPSKFDQVLNDANDELGIETKDVDRVQMCCNGAVYVTNKVFNPVAYISVSFPVLINETMDVLNWGIEQLGFNVYLTSQNSYYSFFIPRNDALLYYVDPCSFGKTTTQLFRFHYKPDAAEKVDKVRAAIWEYDTESGLVGDSLGEASYTQILDRLEDILDTHIIIGNVEDGNTYYTSKGGSVIKVENALSGKDGMTVQGGYQLETGKKLRITAVHDFSDVGNGKTYILDTLNTASTVLPEPIMTARKSVFDILEEHEEFRVFRELLQSSPYLETKHVIGSDEHGCPSPNISLFNTFKYTVYVPTNKAIEDLQSAGKLPTWEEVENETDEERRDSLQLEIENFLKYHIQDNAFYIGERPNSGEFETSAYKVEDGNLQYYKLRVNQTGTDLQVTDAKGNTHKVVTDGGLYNIMAREYQYDTPDAAQAHNLYTSSFAVIHQIDGTLQYK